MNYISATEELRNNIFQVIRNEVDDGILSDVVQVLTGSEMNVILKSPMVHMQLTRTYDAEEYPVSNQKRITSVFQFIGIDYYRDRVSAGERSLNLICRVLTTLEHRVPRTGSLYRIDNFTVEELSNDGEIRITDKNKKIPAAELLFKVDYVIDWRKCYRQALVDMQEVANTENTEDENTQQDGG